MVEEAANFFYGHPEYFDLPRKHKITISTCPHQCDMPEINCIALIGVVHEGREGFAVRIGGGLVDIELDRGARVLRQRVERNAAERELRIRPRHAAGQHQPGHHRLDVSKDHRPRARRGVVEEERGLRVRGVQERRRADQREDTRRVARITANPAQRAGHLSVGPASRVAAREVRNGAGRHAT